MKLLLDISHIMLPYAALKLNPSGIYGEVKGCLQIQGGF